MHEDGDDVGYWCSKCGTPRYYCGCPEEPAAPAGEETCPRCRLVDCSPECIAAEQAELDAYTGPTLKKFA